MLTQFGGEDDPNNRVVCNCGDDASQLTGGKEGAKTGGGGGGGGGVIAGSDGG